MSEPVSTMPIWSGFLTPILEVLADGEVWRKRELVTAVCDHIGLTDAQRAEILPSGQRRAPNRIGWALSALVRAELVTKPARAMFRISQEGRAALVTHPEGLGERELKKIPAYATYVPVRADLTADPVTELSGASDPFEQIEAGVERVHAEVSAELLQRMRSQDPAAFEQTVLDVLVAMGYGGTERRAQRIGGSGDGGVDGVIDQDALGLDQIYVQAKRYGEGNNVGRDTVQAFVGALHGVGASRGVFITTSTFTQHAREYARNVPIRVILIDGQRLAELMIRYGVGVQQRAVFTVVELDEDYFEL
ncbi:restriction endonuclease [Nocardia neocaledoniensis NBRC 108232]|uniref:Restriction system protein n=1 Tax=Nocardia neocaledoniensis TaxID=236511 RepID=A0A317N4H5_9NOCA|nr:restriction endonuclease [Nocardia neocaledoniensis]PWV70191.1 restriction system protein [Nocardia neocaledoniensis]GEM31917.1 restriction endonuclease [Nocardia neocaledoniensis NBRC 108232]